MKFLRSHGFNAIRFLFNHEDVLANPTLEPPNEAEYGIGAPWESPELAHSRYTLSYIALPTSPRHTHSSHLGFKQPPLLAYSRYRSSHRTVQPHRATAPPGPHLGRAAPLLHCLSPIPATHITGISRCS